jgi:hypothetical protein
LQGWIEAVGVLVWGLGSTGISTFA